VKQLCDTQIEHFMQYVSLDTGVAEHAEYIRHGLNYDRCINNSERFLKTIPYRNSLTFIITMSNLNILGLQRLLSQIMALRMRYSTTYQRVWFDTPILRTPSWQSLQTLSPVYINALERIVDWMEYHLETPDKPFQGFKDYEVQRMRRVVDWAREGSKLDPTYIKQQRADFYRFFNEHDKRRGTNFEKTFPQMAEFWKECKYYAHHS
jgi:hypothetical protein